MFEKIEGFFPITIGLDVEFFFFMAGFHSIAQPGLELIM